MNEFEEQALALLREILAAVSNGHAEGAEPRVASSTEWISEVEEQVESAWAERYKERHRHRHSPQDVHKERA